MIYWSGINKTVIKYWERTAREAEYDNDMAICLVSTRYVVCLFGTLLQSTYLSLFLEQYTGKIIQSNRSSKWPSVIITERGCINNRSSYAGRDVVITITREDKRKIILKRRLCPV